MTARTHHILTPLTEAEWSEVLREASGGEVIVATLSDKAEDKGQYPSGGQGYHVEKIPGRIFRITRDHVQSADCWCDPRIEVVHAD